MGEDGANDQALSPRNPRPAASCGIHSRDLAGASGREMAALPRNGGTGRLPGDIPWSAARHGAGAGDGGGWSLIPTVNSASTGSCDFRLDNPLDPLAGL